MILSAARRLPFALTVSLSLLIPALSEAVTQTQTRSTATSVTPGGTWTNSGNAASINGACALGDGSTSTSLTITGWSFAIPAGSTILGITVRSVSSFNDVSTQDQIRLVKASAPVGNTVALNGPGTQSVPSCGSPIPNSSGLTVGGAADLWGTTWTLAEINASGFGVLYDNDFSNTAVDGVEITVTYDDGACGITCPANILKSTDPNQCGAATNYAAPSTTGTCGTITATPASGSLFPKGTTTVTANTTAGPSCTFTVTVNDTQPPLVTCPANVSVTGTPPLPVTYAAPIASDNCPGLTVVCSPASGSAFPLGPTTTSCTSTDASVNTATCSFTVTVSAPVPSLPVWLTVVTGMTMIAFGALWLRRRRLSGTPPAY